MQLILGDCLKEMDRLIKLGVRVDAIITSPPYNIGKMHSNRMQFGTYAGNDMKEADYQKWQIDLLNKCSEILTEGGSIFYNHKVRIKAGVGIHPIEWISKSDLVLKQEITWDMGKSANCDKIRFFPFSERIYWLTRNPKVKLQNVEKLSDVWRLVPTHTRATTKHIAVMPEGIVQNILEAIRPEKVLDPFMGSGTTGAVCKSFGCEFIGIELGEENYGNACERINKV